MKNIYPLLMIFLLLDCNSNAQSPPIDVEIAASISKNILNFELFELAVALPELLSVLEKDSSLWDKKMSAAFDKKLQNEILYIRALELELLKTNVRSNSSIRMKYAKSSKIILDTKEPTLNGYNDFAVPFNSYVKYPEQIDDICLITLLTIHNCNYYKDLQNNKLAAYKFNNWLKYGFNEFRYFPGTQNNVEGKINDRLIKELLTKTECQEQVLVKSSLLMIKSYLKK